MGRLRKLLLLTIPAVIVGLVLVAAAIEVWVRASWDPRKGVPGFFLTDAARGQRLAPNYDGWFAGVPVHINSLGLRDSREYSLTKGPNTFRILVLGDSVTFGHGAVHSYPELLEQKLRAWRPDVDWQVWNAAVPGYNTSQELAHLLDVGPRFEPDLVIVGFFENDLTDNTPVAEPGPIKRAVAAVLSVARRHLYSLEFYKKLYLQLAWRLSGSNAYKLRVENIASEEELISSVKDASQLKEQAITPYQWLTDEQVREVRCYYGMKPGNDVIPAIQRDPGYAPWLEAVRRFQQLAREGRYRIVFFLNVIPPACRDEDVFYDGGTAAINAFYLRIMGDGTPAVSCYDAFRHVRPSQMPNATAHAFGNSNELKAKVLFDFLRDKNLTNRH